MAFSNFHKKIKIKTIHTLLPRLGVSALAFFIIFGTTAVPFASARTFNPHNIITDAELTDKNSLTKTAIQKFLEREGSVLANYSQNVSGRTIRASEIIWEVAQKHNINPKFLLTTLEKEQGLVQKSQASEKALDWATGYSCFGGTCNEKHKGFYNQTSAAAETQAIYLARAGQFGFKTGQTTVTSDGYKVTPQNNATTNLYIYTPYVGHAPELGIFSQFGANKLFWRIWHKYFSSQPFVDGQVITFNGTYYLVENNTKRKFASKDVFLKDYSESDAINVSSKYIAAYPDGPAINFADNTLVRSSASGQIFLLTSGVKRPILNNSALALLSDFNIAVTENDVPSVPDSLIEYYPLGSAIDTNALYPQGKLFKEPSGQIWLIKDGLKHAVDQAVWVNNFASETPESIASVEIYPTGEPVKLRDGTFVTINGTYYLISQGSRMRIQDLGVFDRIFGASKKASALKVSSALLQIHTPGENIDYIDDTIQDPPSTVSTPPTVTTNYAGSFESMAPDGLIMVNGQTQQITVNFRNTGSTNWQKGSVYLKITDRGSQNSSFGAPAKVEMDESLVGNNQSASFTFSLTAPADKAGLLDQQFSLYYDKAGAPTQITSVGKFIIVKSGLAAEITNQNIPVAVRNDWQPITINMDIKNASPDTAWLSRRTALELRHHNGSTSPFHDPNDWVRSEVVGVPLNASTIAPGENGEFTFTLDPRGVKPGIYMLVFELKLLDKDKQPYLNGGLQWKREIRVDG